MIHCPLQVRHYLEVKCGNLAPCPSKHLVACQEDAPSNFIAKQKIFVGRFCVDENLRNNRQLIYFRLLTSKYDWNSCYEKRKYSLLNHCKKTIYYK